MSNWDSGLTPEQIESALTRYESHYYGAGDVPMSIMAKETIRHQFAYNAHWLVPVGFRVVRNPDETLCPICHRDGERLSPDPNCPRCAGTFVIGAKP